MWEPSNCWTLCVQISSCHATHSLAVDILGRNWYAWNRQIGTQLIRMKQTSWDATDTHEADKLGRNWYAWSTNLGTQLIRVKQASWDATDTHEADIFGRNWYAWSRHLGTHLIRMKHKSWNATDTHEADILGRNWYAWSRNLGTQLIRMKQTSWNAIDKHEADIFGRNWYVWNIHPGTQMTQFVNLRTQIWRPRQIYRTHLGYLENCVLHMYHGWTVFHSLEFRCILKLLLQSFYRVSKFQDALNRTETDSLTSKLNPHPTNVENRVSS